MFLCLPEELYILSAFFVSHFHSVLSRSTCLVEWASWPHGGFREGLKTYLFSRTSFSTLGFLWVCWELVPNGRCIPHNIGYCQYLAPWAITPQQFTNGTITPQGYHGRPSLNSGGGMFKRGGGGGVNCLRGYFQGGGGGGVIFLGCPGKGGGGRNILTVTVKGGGNCPGDNFLGVIVQGELSDTHT